MIEGYPNFPDALADSRALAWTCRQSRQTANIMPTAL
jgi:hypothetical protein